MTDMRVGYGWDVHRLVAGRALRIGGVAVPHTKGLMGHSDGDVVLHAVADAVLGAAGLGDIGEFFPDTDSTIEGIDSADILGRCIALARERNLIVGNMDITVIAQEPMLGSHKARMGERIAEVTGTDVCLINVKAKTAERLGDIGAGEAIAAHVVVALVPAD